MEIVTSLNDSAGYEYLSVPGGRRAALPRSGSTIDFIDFDRFFQKSIMGAGTLWKRSNRALVGYFHTRKLEIGLKFWQEGRKFLFSSERNTILGTWIFYPCTGVWLFFFSGSPMYKNVRKIDRGQVELWKLVFWSNLMRSFDWSWP